LHLEILLWYFCRADEYGFEGNATRIEYAEHLVADRMLSKESGPVTYSITERGRFWLEHILSLPFPKQTWVIPSAS
jgi:hypothetical protein